MSGLLLPRLSIGRLSCSRLINFGLQTDSRLIYRSDILNRLKVVQVNRALCNAPYRYSNWTVSSRLMCTSGPPSDRKKPAASQKELAREKSELDGEPEEPTEEKKLGLVARFKEMYKKYWYVLVPVHVITSTGWLALFYYLSASGVDIPSLLQSINVSETWIEKLKDSKMGHFAIAYMCYKISTPVRYTVTLGGTTYAIKYLSQKGYIRPAPAFNRENIRKMYVDHKEERARRRSEEKSVDSASDKTFVSSMVASKSERDVRPKQKKIN